MNEDMTADVDPLSTYLSYPLNNYTQSALEYQNPVKQESFVNYNLYGTHLTEPETTENNCNVTNNRINENANVPSSNNEVINTNTAPLVDFKPCLPTRRRKIKKEKSSYFSEKILEKDFPFYGCAVCNINFKALQELDAHVPIHKDRITSYDLRIKNQIKKKKLQKELKKNKKAKKNIKKEFSVEIEIKPEDGYIGDKKTSDFTTEDNLSSKENNGNETDNNKNQNKEPSNLNAPDKNDEDATRKQERNNLQKIYKCFACQKQFMLSYYLKLHVRSHTDEKPYTCSQCGQSFITASKLGRHNKRYHLAVRHQCRICFRFFSRFEFLTRHFDKKHPDDKLEGEPYDYNAILPYLKELEAELKEKETEQDKKKEEPWSELPEDNKDYIVKEELQIEEVKVDMDVEIKFETEIEEPEKEDIKEEVSKSDGYGWFSLDNNHYGNNEVLYLQLFQNVLQIDS